AGRAEGPADTPEGRELVGRHLRVLIDFVADARTRRPSRKVRTQKSLTAEVWDLVEPVSDGDLALAMLVGVLNICAAPLENETDCMARSMKMVGCEIERAVQGARIRSAGLKKRIERAAGHKFNRKDRFTALNRIVKLARWTWRQRFDVGGWAYDCCLQALPTVIVRGEHGPLIAEGEWQAAADLSIE